MSYNKSKIFSHSLSDTLNNIRNGFIKYYTYFTSSSNNTLLENTSKNIALKTDLSDLSPLGLYKNNFEPQPLKEIQKIIGTDATYSYIARKGAAIFLQNALNYGELFLSMKVNALVTQMLQGTYNHFMITSYMLSAYFKNPIIEATNFLSQQLIYTQKHDIELKHFIKAKIAQQDKFMSLYLKENAENEYQSLENNIISILTYYSSNIGTIMTAASIIPIIYTNYKFLSKQSHNIKISLAASACFAIAETSLQYYTKNTLMKIDEENSYRNTLSQVNIGADQYRLKETIFVVGSKHLNDREILHDKLSLKLAEENISLNTVSLLLNFKIFHEIISFALNAKNAAVNAQLLLQNNDQNKESTNTKLISDSGTFLLTNNLLFSQILAIKSLFFSDSNFDLRAKQISNIIEMIDNYSNENDKNHEIYQNNNSTKLIISNLKANAIAINQTIVDFSDFELAIDIAPGMHYLWEGQNSVGKSLLLKLIIGYSGGLAVTGNISYPKELNTADIAYVLQDDYYGLYKPLLHRLAAPKFLPADIIVKDSIETNLLSEDEFEHFVNFMAELLFEMKYEPKWQSIEAAKEALLENYENYKGAFETGSKEKLDELVESYNQQTGGQKKKLAIANAIYNKAKLVMLDESFNAIDQEAKLIIYKLIEKHLSHATVIAIQHQVANHLIEQKEIQENDAKVLKTLETIMELSNSSDDPKMKEIHDLAKEVLNTDTSVFLNAEELLFFHGIITMNRLQTEYGKVKTSFQIVSLQKENEHLVEFYPLELKISGDVCDNNTINILFS